MRHNGGDMQPTTTPRPPRPTWGRLLATLVIGFALVLGAVAACAQPLHLVKGLQLADEIGGAQDAGVFNDAQNVPLNRYGGSWNSASDPSFIRFANLGAGVLPANNTKCSPLVTHLLKHCYNWNWSAHAFYDPVLKINKTSASPAPYQYIALLKAGRDSASRSPGSTRRCPATSCSGGASAPTTATTR